MVQPPQIMIDMGIQRDGYTFRLDPLSRVWLEDQYPDRSRVASVFIGFDRRQEFQQIPESIWRQVSQMLTGLITEDLNKIGGFVIINPLTEQPVFESATVNENIPETIMNENHGHNAQYMALV